MAKLFIGCKLPNGLTLELITPQLDPETKKPLNVLHPSPRNEKARVTLNGANSINTKILHAAQVPVYGKTLVDEELWGLWLKANSQHPAVLNGSLFAAKNEEEFDAKSRAGIKVIGGFEPLDAGSEVDVDGVVITADKDQLKRLQSAPR